MPTLAVTAVGADQPGIIAAVTGVLLEHGGNLEDASMTILGGQFAVMLLVECDEGAASLERALADATEALGLVVTVREVGEGAHSPPPTHMLSVYGEDRPGLVHAVAAALAAHDVNVTDLTSRVLEGEHSVYAMLFEVSLPDGLDEGEVLDAIREAEGLSGTDASLSPLDVTTF